MAGIIRTDATNTGAGPHMLNAIPPVRVEAGQSVHDVEITQAEYESAKRFKVFTFSHNAAAAPAEDDDRAELIRTAIEGLDAKDDAHWTDAGLPAVDAVSEALGETVTRAEIKAAAPDAKRSS